MRNFEDFYYNLDTKRLELYSEGKATIEINPLKVIKESLEPKACYLIPNDQEVIVFDKIGRDICNINIWEIVDLWESKKVEANLYKKYLEDVDA